MAAGKSVVFLAVLTFLWTLNGGDAADAEVTCVVMESCVLPCSFQGGNDEVIHWIQLAGGKKVQVHSYYYIQDQLDNQDQRFRGRTSLFKDQLSRGNASLKLTGVEVQDQGRYQCYTSTRNGNKESFINLKVEAPVHKVDIQQVKNRITCSSEGIYPEPELTWSTSPPSSKTFNETTTVQQTEQQLYSITSSLTPSDGDTDLIYTCTVGTRRKQMTATLFKSTRIDSSGSEETLHCPPSDTPPKSLVWTFNHSHIIVIQTGRDAYTVSEEWRQQVKAVSESGSLTLQGLSSGQQGVYTCERTNDEGSQVKNTCVWIMEKQIQDTHVAAIVAGVVGTVVLISVLAVVLCKSKKAKKETTPDNSNPEQQPMNSGKAK